LPINTPANTNEATATHGKTTTSMLQPLSINCIAVKESPTTLGFNLQVHSTGKANAKAPKLKTTALKKTKKAICTIRRGVLNFNSLLLSLVSLKYYAFCNP
jgi:hypothetical protein